MFGSNLSNGQSGPVGTRDFIAAAVGFVLGGVATYTFMTRTDKGAAMSVENAAARIAKQRKSEGKSSLATTLAASNAKLNLGGLTLAFGGPASDTSDAATAADAARSAPRAYTRQMRSRMGQTVLAYARSRGSV